MLPERRVAEKGPEWQIGIMEITHKQDLWKYMNEWFKVLQYLVTDSNGAIVKGGGKGIVEKSSQDSAGMFDKVPTLTLLIPANPLTLTLT